jgi:hypothetical protein
MGGVEVRDEHEGHPRVDWHRTQQLLERVEAPGGRADANHRKSVTRVTRAIGPRIVRVASRRLN